MIFRIYPTQDTFLTNQQRLNVPQTASNFGASEVVQVYKIVGLSGALGAAGSSSFGHALFQFDLTPIMQLTASNFAPAQGAQFRLHLFDARHTGSLPNGYDMEVLATSQAWSEGTGHDIELFSDLQAANWVQATSTTFWSTPGASGTMPIPFHFNTGFEDLDLDVTPIVNAWLTGGLVNNGFLVRLSSTLETNNVTYYLKEFFTRQTFLDYATKMPYIEMRWDDSVRDDRNNFVFDNSGTLFLYNEVRGALTNLPLVGTGSMIVVVTDMSSSLFAVTASFTGQTGVYSASFVLPTGSSYSGSTFHDIWTSTGSYGTKVYMTGTFFPVDTFQVQNIYPSLYTVSMPQLKARYEQAEVPRMSLFVRPKDYNPAVVLTASSDLNGTVITKAYYRIRNDRTDEDVVPFGTGSYVGSFDTTRLSYDQRGNYFKFYMSSLPRGQVYRVTYLLDVDGQLQLVDGDFKFRVI